MNSIIDQPRDLKPLECPECFSALLLEDNSRGESICVTCGLVISEKPARHSQTSESARLRDERKPIKGSTSQEQGHVPIRARVIGLDA